jgi:RNA polymerase sigma factor (sigma-70 family)
VSVKEHHGYLARQVAEARDRAAFKELFDYYAPRINAYLLKLGSEQGTSEEITQDVMTTLWRKAHMFDPAKSSLGTWLFRVARNRRIDILRKQQMNLADIDDFSFEDISIPDPDDQLDGYTREQQVEQAMKSLPEEQLDLIKMAFFSDLSHSQIADETGLPLGTVKSRIRLAFGRLRRLLEKDVDPEDLL